MQTQAIYDLRTDGRGPAGFRVGREIRFRVSDVLRWLDGLHEPDRRFATTEPRPDGGATPAADQYLVDAVRQGGGLTRPDCFQRRGQPS
ncbi:helix-turn-helix domain-containing protein [Cryobacterium melibiosiphilum]|uniref:helix-turn-helix transcriptional regulator n=1 Tax=Cryobacterium melibiosiphilum TaxID=995039 RepID=UPI002D77EDC8|nr:helix-turn-helix domain-containing protein [Cryobacterium melibiosiphilum]